MNDSYPSVLSSLIKRNKFWRQGITIGIYLVVCGLLAGPLIGAFSMMKSFSDLGENVGDRQNIASGISLSLTAAAIGKLIAVFVGLPVLLISNIQFFQSRGALKALRIREQIL